MSKYDLSWTEEKYNKRRKEGRGQGTSNDYIPWITVHDFPSDGFSSRGPGWKANRVFHFMSTLELRCFYLYEWSDIIIDIREQFPLELEDTLRIANELDIKHPMDNVSKFPRVFTTDFMLTAIINGKEANIARTVKQAKDIESMRVLEKFEVERRYWAEKGIDWGIITENDIPKAFTENIQWVHDEYWLEPTTELGINEQLEICETLKERLKKNDCVINNVTSSLDRELNLERGTCLGLFKHLLARKEIVIDMHKKITGGSSTRDIRIFNSDNKVKAL